MRMIVFIFAFFLIGHGFAQERPAVSFAADTKTYDGLHPTSKAFGEIIEGILDKKINKKIQYLTIIEKYHPEIACNSELKTEVTQKIVGLYREMLVILTEGYDVTFFTDDRGKNVVVTSERRDFLHIMRMGVNSITK